MATLTLDPRQAWCGDTLMAVDDAPLKPMTIDRRPVTRGATTILHLQAPPHSSIEWRQYLEPGQKVTVERVEPEVTVRTVPLSDLLDKVLKPKTERRATRPLTAKGAEK